MRQHWALVTPKFWVNFQSDIFKLTFPDHNTPYPYFRLQPMCYPNSQWTNRPLLVGIRTKPRLGSFLWTQNEPVPGFWNRIKHLALGLSIDRARFQNYGLEFSVWSRNAADDFCTHFVASIRTKFPNLNQLSFVVGLDPTVPQLHGQPYDRMELRPLRFAPLVHGNGPAWEGRARLEKLELDIKSFYWNEFGATGVHDNIGLVVEVPGNVMKGKN
ncbi:hypothetical protein B0J14DRAFT_586701 [Halenospora varia]|nr:hypothetical protein B0J14DRAFT_586701 [Halenospora varia]